MTFATQHTPESSNLRQEGTSTFSDCRPIRVAFLIDRLGVGGTETQLLALLQHLDRSQVEPFLILLKGEDEESRLMEPDDIQVLRLGVRSLRSGKAIQQVCVLARFLRQERIDILQMYFPDSTYFGVLAGKMAGVKTLIRTRNNSNHWMTPTHRLLGRLLNRFVTLTVCNSEAGREAVLRDERPDPASVVVIENGVDVERFAHIPPVDPDPDPGRRVRVGMVGNLREIKGVDLLVRAAAKVVEQFSNVEFVVVGEGDQRPELERLIAEAGLTKQFHLPGRCEDIPGFLATLDLAVLSSRSEGTPNALLEYMAAGRPIVASAVGGIGRLIRDEVDGILVPPGNVDRLALAMAGLLGDPDRRAALGRAARMRVVEFARPRVVSRFEALFRTSVGCVPSDER